MAELFQIDRATRHVRGLPEKYWSRREAASILGISRNRLIRLARLMPEQLGPGAVTWLGDVKIYLYRDEDLDALRDYFAHPQRPRSNGHLIRGGRGREPLWDNEEDADRHRRRVKARYHRTRAEDLEQHGAVKLAAKHWARSRALTEQLHVEQERRLAERG